MAEQNNERLITTDTLYTFKLEQDLYNIEKFKLKSDATDLKGAVRYDAAQVLTEEQKAQARANIGAGTGDGTGGSGEDKIVIIEPETFDEETGSGTVSDEAIQKFNDNANVKPIYFNLFGIPLAHIGEGVFTYCSGVGMALQVILDLDTRQFTIEEVEASGTGGGVDIEQDFQGTLIELENTVPSRLAVMRYIGENSVLLDTNGKVPSDKLPSYVDDVIEGYYNETQGQFFESVNDEGTSFSNELPTETGKIYLDLFTNNTYRWSGTQYVRINPDEYTVATNEDIYALFNK